jgi:hypothetical protein
MLKIPLPSIEGSQPPFPLWPAVGSKIPFPTKGADCRALIPHDMEHATDELEDKQVSS